MRHPPWTLQLRPGEFLDFPCFQFFGDSGGRRLGGFGGRGAEKYFEERSGLNQGTTTLRLPPSLRAGAKTDRV
jgi:hypothetical protein